jgi:hypothetical protein
VIIPVTDVGLAGETVFGDDAIAEIHFSALVADLRDGDAVRCARIVAVEENDMGVRPLRDLTGKRQA